MASCSSCLVEKLENYVSLSDSDRTLLATIEEDTEDVEADSVLMQRGDRCERLFVVKSGWLYSYTILADGRRKVLRIHYPGDIVGLEHLPFVGAIHDCATATSATLCPFPKDRLDRILVESPRLSAILWSFSVMENATLLDRIRVVGRMNAEERLAHLLLEVASRLRIVGVLGDDATFELPLSQSVLGDAIGLTNVYVSKTLAKMENDGLIQRNQRKFSLLDEVALRDMAEFTNRFERMDVTWFPAAATAPAPCPEAE